MIARSYFEIKVQPKFKLVDMEQDDELELTDDEKIDLVAARVLKKYRKAFEELAK